MSGKLYWVGSDIEVRLTLPVARCNRLLQSDEINLDAHHRSVPDWAHGLRLFRLAIAIYHAKTTILLLVPSPKRPLRSEYIPIVWTRELFHMKCDIFYITFQQVTLMSLKVQTIHLRRGKRKNKVRVSVLKAEPFITAAGF